MTARLSRTDRAERDLLAIWAHIARDNPMAADATLDQLDEASRSLAVFPSLGPARKDLGPGVRYFPVDNYVIIYQSIAQGVEVIRYLHGHRQILEALAEADAAEAHV